MTRRLSSEIIALKGKPWIGRFGWAAARRDPAVPKAAETAAAIVLPQGPIVPAAIVLGFGIEDRAKPRKLRQEPEAHERDQEPVRADRPALQGDWARPPCCLLNWPDVMS